MATFDMKEYARRGAQARITELNQELEAIYGAFPDLRTGRRKAVVNHEEQRTARGRNGGAATAAQESVAVTTPRTRNRRPMTAAERKAVSERMRKYWAGRRKTKSARSLTA